MAYITSLTFTFLITFYCICSLVYSWLIKYLLCLTYTMVFLYFNQILHIIFSPFFFSIFFYDPTHHRILFCGKPHYFLMHGYLLMYCVYNTLCISLNWWIHLHPLENKNSLKGQSHIFLAVLPEAGTDYFSCFVEEKGAWKGEKKTEKKKEVQWVAF